MTLTRWVQGSPPPRIKGHAMQKYFFRFFSRLFLAGLATAAQANPSCSLSIGGNLAFGSFMALAGVPDATTHTGSALTLTCTPDVGNAPTLYSPTARVLTNGSHTLPFSLSAVSAGGPDLPTTQPGVALSVPADNTPHIFTLYGRILGTDLGAAPAGFYTTNLVLVLSY